MGTVTLTINNAGCEFTIKIDASGTIPKEHIRKIFKSENDEGDGYDFLTIKDITSVTIDGDDITEIGSMAFDNCTSLTSVTIPEGVTYIWLYAFRDCTGLTEVIIPEGVTYIEDSAFINCTGLQSIIIPNSITELGPGTFEGCTSLKSVIIPEGVIHIWDAVFEFCTGLTSVIIPASVTSIGDYAFKHCGLESIIIPDSVTEIGEEAFYGCTELQSIIIPDSVTEIGENAFYAFMGIYNMVIVHSDESKGKLKNSIVQCDNNPESEAEFTARREGELSRIFCLETDLNPDEHLIDYNTYQQLPRKLQIIFTQCLAESRTGFNEKKEHTFDKILLAEKILSAAGVGVPSSTEQAPEKASKALLYYALNINALGATSRSFRRETGKILNAGDKSEKTAESSTSPKRHKPEAEACSTPTNETPAEEALRMVAQHLLTPN